MAKFSNGIFGNFYGKIGNVVGSNWRGIDYLRSLPKVNKNRVPSQAQMEQQAKFALITAFLASVRPVIDFGYKSLAIGQTPYNVALSDNIKNAIGGNYPEYTVDYAALSFSRGVLPMALNVAVEVAAGLQVNFAWTDNSGKGKANAIDKVTALLVCPEEQESEFSIGTVTRQDEALSLTVPASWAGKQVECYFFLNSANGRETTNTFYGGGYTILA